LRARTGARRGGVKAIKLPDEAIRIEDRWYVLATSARAGDPTRVLKHGESFVLFDRFGDVPRVGSGEHGLYHQGTRFLSCYEMRLHGQRPILLNSNVRRDNSVLTVDVTNPDVYEGDKLSIVKGTIHVARSWLLDAEACHEQIAITNFGQASLVVHLAFEFDADYADIFEVRGYTRSRRGEALAPQASGDEVTLGYTGLDGVRRRTRIAWSIAPARLAPDRAEFEIRLEARASTTFSTQVCCGTGESRRDTASYDAVAHRASAALRDERVGHARIESDNEHFNAWIERSAADLAMLVAGNPESGYPYAGVPWYSVPFGRDGILTALQCLWVDPGMARGVLAFLAETQARSLEPARDAEPGKIVHEMRKGELAALGEIPFGRYYGTIDATPLFVVLAGEYHQRTGDIATLERVWPAVVKALAWIDAYGDLDGDGFVEYQRRSATGLVNQGWKDSEDSIFHADGTIARAPIALAEVQGYVHLAKVHAARLARALGDPALGGALEAQARELHERFERAFWSDDIGTYAIALDGDKRACLVRSSNVGHVLWSGIARPQRARLAGETLLSSASFSGWGVRTIAEGEARYNPMSYHNGSIWPHDNAVTAMGLARYGMKDKSALIAAALYDASLYMDLHRLPELFCGFARRDAGQGPTLYPVACSPQAWAAASVFYLVKACLGLSFRPEEPRIRFLNPRLPEFVDRLKLGDLRVAGAVVDVLFERQGDQVGVNIVRKEGRVDVSVVL
jgi:glycogen debranching enzyme